MMAINYSFYVTQFHRARGQWNAAFYLFTIGGAVFMVLDMFTNFPTPMRGEFALWWIGVILIGLWCRRRYNQAAHRAAWKLLEQQHRYDVDWLAKTLSLSLTDAEAIMMRFVNDGNAAKVFQEAFIGKDAAERMEQRSDGMLTIEMVD